MFFSFALSLSIVLLIISRALARAAYTIEMMGFSPLLFRLHFYFFSLSVMLWAKESEWLRLCAALIAIIYACWGETKRKRVREREALFTYDDDRVALFNYYYFLFHYYLLMVVVVVVVDHILYILYWKRVETMCLIKLRERI